MKKILFFVEVVLLSFNGFCQQAKTYRFFGNKVEIAVPVEFHLMTDAADSSNYVFEDNPATSRFSILTSTTEIDDNAIPDYANRAIAAIKTQRNPATIFDDGISLNNGKNISYIKYSFEKEPSPNFEYVFYGSLDEKLLTFYFFCPAGDRAKWEKRIDAMVATLKINDKITP